jgi:hypothetical protein
VHVASPRVDLCPLHRELGVEVDLREHERRGDLLALRGGEHAVDELGLERRRDDARDGEHVRDVRREHLRLVLALGRGAPVQLRRTRQDLVDRLAGRVEHDVVADRERPLLVRPRREQLARERELAPFPVHLDVADLRVDA